MENRYTSQPPAVIGGDSRQTFFAPVRKAVASYFRGARIEPRKGDNPGANPRRIPHGSKDNLQDPPPRVTAPGYSIEDLANRDDVVFAIRNTLRRAVGEMDWKIVPDLENIKADLKRWQTIVQLNLMYPEYQQGPNPLMFVPQALDLDFFFKAKSALNSVTQDMLSEGDTPTTSLRMREFFANALKYHEVVALGHVNRVKAIFEHPNPSADSSFRALLDSIINYLTLYDQAPLIKNPTVRGDLAELYTIPGDQVRVYRCEDLSTPQPPEIAYDWYDEARVRASYNNLELVFMRMNPAADGYGTSPILTILRKMVGSMYGDQYLNDGFSNSNIPNFVFDLGPEVSQDERDQIEEKWDQQVGKGQRRGIFIGSKDGVKGFIPLQAGSNRDQEVLEILKYWANVKCAAYGLSLNDIGFTEDLHRTTSETQAELTQSRGVNSMATTIESFFNGEVIKGKLWLRENPLDPDSLLGQALPCFPFRDVKFEFVRDEKESKLEDAQRAESLIGIGVLSRNEMREELSLPPVAGGDILTVDTQPGCKVEDLQQLPIPQAQPAPGEGGDPNDPNSGGAEDGEKPPSGPKPPQPPKPPMPKVAPGSGSNGDQAQKRMADLNVTLMKMLTPEES